MRRLTTLTALLGPVVALSVFQVTYAASTGTAAASTTSETTPLIRYNVVFEGSVGQDGFSISGGRAEALDAIQAAGGTILYDLSRQIGVVTAVSTNPLFAEQLAQSSAVDVAAQDFAWKAFPSYEEALASGELTLQSHPSEPLPGGGPEETADPLEPLQWSMLQIRAPQAHEHQAGSPLVEVGILDSGIDGRHPDFVVDDGGTNVVCAPPKAADFTTAGPGIGNPDPCTDNQFHGTHVAGIVAAQANQIGVVGVAPNVTLIPVKVCDTIGYCYSSNTAAGIVHAGDQKFEVINMSFFVDDEQFLESTMYKCMSDPVQRAFRLANERAIQYARNQGVVPVAALGNSDDDLAHPPEPYENNCEVVPAETEGVIGTMALGPGSEKAFYSNYGFGATDVAAPGGNSRSNYPAFPGPCGTQVLSTLPAGSYGCLQGTSMASPHAAGVAALIVSQFGRVGTDAGETDVVMRPQEVENYLQSTTVDLYFDSQTKGYDECFGNGRVDALRAVQHDTSNLAQLVEPCPESQEPPPPSS